MWQLWDSPRLARLLPYLNLIIVENCFPPVAAVPTSLVWSQLPGWRRFAATAALGVTVAFGLVQPLLGSASLYLEMWAVDGICVQTTDTTCSPACTTTLLRMHGIVAAEQEMAVLCLMRAGTRWQSLYRGLKRKTDGTRCDVEIVHCPADELTGHGGSMIAAAGL